jgi:DNA-binding transcriptional MerR regulator
LGLAAEKGPDAFRTISEVAEDLDLPQHVLRFWETRFAQIKPLKRGGGRRYYRPDDIELLRGIRHLLYGDGYTIRGVQQILREQGVRHVQSIGRSAEVDAPKPAAGFNTGFRGTVDDRPSAPREGGMALIDLLPSLRSSRPTPELPRVVEVPTPQQRSAVDVTSDEEMPPFPFRRSPAQLSPAEMATRLAPRPAAEPEGPVARPQNFVRPVEARMTADPSRLSAEAVRLLKATLFELGECKRLLDAGREEPA